VGKDATRYEIIFMSYHSSIKFLVTRGGKVTVSFTISYSLGMVFVNICIIKFQMHTFFVAHLLRLEQANYKS